MQGDKAKERQGDIDVDISDARCVRAGNRGLAGPVGTDGAHLRRAAAARDRRRGQPDGASRGRAWPRLRRSAWGWPARPSACGWARSRARPRVRGASSWPNWTRRGRRGSRARRGRPVSPARKARSHGESRSRSSPRRPPRSGATREPGQCWPTPSAAPAGRRDRLRQAEDAAADLPKRRRRPNAVVAEAVPVAETPAALRKPAGDGQARKAGRPQADFRHRAEAGAGLERLRHLDLSADRGADARPRSPGWTIIWALPGASRATTGSARRRRGPRPVANEDFEGLSGGEGRPGGERANAGDRKDEDEWLSSRSTARRSRCPITTRCCRRRRRRAPKSRASASTSGCRSPATAACA